MKRIYLIIASLLLFLTAGCTVSGLIYGNIQDERMAIDKAPESESILDSCMAGDTVLLIDTSNNKHYGIIDNINHRKSLTLRISDKNSVNDYSKTTFSWNNVESIHKVTPEHSIMIRNTITGFIIDITLVVLYISLFAVGSPGA